MDGAGDGGDAVLFGADLSTFAGQLDDACVRGAPSRGQVAGVADGREVGRGEGRGFVEHHAECRAVELESGQVGSGHRYDTLNGDAVDRAGDCGRSRPDGADLAAISCHGDGCRVGGVPERRFAVAGVRGYKAGRGERSRFARLQRQHGFIEHEALDEVGCDVDGEGFSICGLRYAVGDCGGSGAPSGHSAVRVDGRYCRIRGGESKCVVTKNIS